MEILLIEDDTTLVSMYQKELHREGFNSIVASDGESALDIAFANHPNLILLDLTLPKLSGLEVMHKLRQDEWGKTVPIIILTNSEPDNDILDAVSKGNPAFYLIKSDVTPEGIILKIKEILE